MSRSAHSLSSYILEPYNLDWNIADYHSLS